MKMMTSTSPDPRKNSMPTLTKGQWMGLCTAFKCGQGRRPETTSMVAEQMPDMLMDALARTDAAKKFGFDLDDLIQTVKGLPLPARMAALKVTDRYWAATSRDVDDTTE